MSENWTPEDEDRLRRALHEEAAHVLPSPGGLERIVARARRNPARPWWLPSPAVIGVAAALLAAVTVIGAGFLVLRDPENAVTAGIDTTTAPGSPTPSPTTTSSTPDATREPAPEEEPATPSTLSEPPATAQEPRTAFSGAVAVYYLSDTPAGPRLVREWRHLTSVRDAPTAAVDLMLDDPSVPDYRNPWDPETEVRSVRIDDDSIDVDLSLPGGTPDAAAPEDAELAIQQLVYTATAAASVVGDADQGSLPVRILVEGERVDQLWGIDVSETLTRAPADLVRQLVQLNDPSEGAEVSSPVRVSGEALVFEATLLWEVRQDDEVVAEGSTMTEDGLVLSEFAFDVELDPGEYTLVIREDDPSGGEGRPPMTDERRFTVTD